MKVYKHILYATDLLKESDQVAKKAQKLAEALEAKLSLVHIVENVPTAYGSPVVLDVEGTLHDEAEHEIFTKAKKFGIEKKDCYVLSGSTKPQVIELAEKIKSDLILVGSHGRHGLAILLGSTAGAVLDGAPCDVLAIKIHED